MFAHLNNSRIFDMWKNNSSEQAEGVQPQHKTTLNNTKSPTL